MGNKIEIPVSPTTLASAMESAGLDVASLSKLLGKDPADLQAWLDGTDQPGKTDLKKLSRVLRRPPSFFLLTTPPSEVRPRVAFRGEAKWRDARRLLPEEEDALRQAQRAQRVVRWIREKRDQRPLGLPAVSPDQPPTMAAGLIQTWLGWTSQIQRSASSKSAAANEFRSTLADAGILVLHLSLTDDGCRGFSLWDEYAPVIVVNTRQNTPARLFTYVHELGHLVTKTNSMCVGLATRDDRIERWAESFAANFLMPPAAFEEAYRYWVARESDQIEMAKRIASRFKTSVRSTAIRLIETDRADRSLYEEIDRSFDFGKSGRGFNPDPAAPGTRLREWGETYARELLAAERSDLLDRTDVLSYLRLSDKEVREVERRLAETSA